MIDTIAVQSFSDILYNQYIIQVLENKIAAQHARYVLMKDYNNQFIADYDYY